MMRGNRPRSPEAIREAVTLARGARVTFLGHLSGRVLGFLSTLVLTRWLGASDFGLFILALAIFQCAGLFGDLGLRYGALRFVALAVGRQDQGEGRRVIGTVIRYSTRASIVGAAVLLATTPLLAGWFRQPAFRWLIPVLALSLPFATVGTVLMSVLQAFKRLGAIATLWNFVDPLVRIGVFVAFAALGWGVGAAVISHLAAAIGVLGGALLWLRPQLPAAGDRSTRGEEGQILAFSLPMSLSHVASLAIQSADSLFLGYFTTARDVGIYGVASRVAALGGMALLAASMSFSPQANVLYGRGDLEGIGQLYRQVTRWLIVLSLPLFVLTVVFAPWVLTLFGAEFREGWLVLLILLFGTFMNVVTGPAGDLAVVAGRSRIVLAVAVALAVLNISLNWALVPRWGIIGGAVAMATTVATSNVTNVLLGWWFLRLQPYNAAFIRPLTIGAGATLLTAVVSVAVDVGPAQGILLLLTWVVAYPLVLIRLAANSEDRAVVRALLTWSTPLSRGGR